MESEVPALRIPPPGFLSEPGLHDVLEALPDARVVGGAVRDALLGQDVHDIDLATPMQPDAVIAALHAAGLKSAPTGLAHGTVTAIAHHRGFEVTTLRCDVATDGRHATVAFTEDWRADAARRDFTINALSLNPDGDVFDYFAGIPDLHAGRVRFVGDATTRIREDYLRILRFFRFHARFGRGEPDAAALAAIAANLGGIARLSVERIWSELRRILAALDPVATVNLMARLGVLPAIIPEGADPARLAAPHAAGAPPDPILRLAALLTGDTARVATRLKLSNAERDRLLALKSGPAPAPTDDDDELRRQLAATPNDVLIGRAWLSGSTDPAWTQLRARLAAISRPVFALEGRDVLALGIPPGPGVGALLRHVRDWWLSQGCRPDAEACRAELARMAGTLSPPP